MNANSKAARIYLLTTVSSIALISPMFASGSVLAAGSGNEAAVWVEMGIESGRVKDSTDNFALPIGSLIPSGGLTGPLTEGLNLSRSQSEDGKLTFQPSGSDWSFSAAVTFGRSRGRGGINQQAPIPTTSIVTYGYYVLGHPSQPVIHSKPVPRTSRSFSADMHSTEAHTVLDFSAGKDVGLGMFGHGSTSVLSAGVRIANFATKINTVQFQGVTGFGVAQYTHIHGGYHYTSQGQFWHGVIGNGREMHKFTGMGPSLRWDASVALAGDENRGGEFLLDWGANAALLFGKQKNKVTHKSTSTYNCYSAAKAHFGQFAKACHAHYVRYAPQSGEARSTKNVTVPNLGGFAAISYRVDNFKASFGYRADYFLRAIDTGVSGQRSVTRSFQGPFASISVGIGD